ASTREHSQANDSSCLRASWASEGGLAQLASHERDPAPRARAVARGASDLGTFGLADYARLHACASRMAARSHETARARDTVPKSKDEPERRDSELVGTSAG